MVRVQLMMPEAVAIVCSPRESPNYGVFGLIAPDGLELIRHCDGRGFHTHANRPIYRVSKHVAVVKGDTQVWAAHLQLRVSGPLAVRLRIAAPCRVEQVVDLRGSEPVVLS